VRAFRDEPRLAARQVKGRHQILVIYAPRARSRLKAALISDTWVLARLYESTGRFMSLVRFSPILGISSTAMRGVRLQAGEDLLDALEVPAECGVCGRCCCRRYILSCH
jgi:hypothetical protein